MTRTLTLIALLVLASTASAARVPSQKVPGMRHPGARGDITLPYLSTGYSALGVAQGVYPIVYYRPTVSDPVFPGILPVYDRVFYGARQSFSGISVGAMPGRAYVVRRYR